MTTTAETYVIGSGGKPTIKKDPNATLDYTFDWGEYLALISDTLALAEFLVDGTLVVVSQTFTPTAAQAFVSGGTIDDTETLTCRITTTGGRIDDRSVYLKIIDR